MKRRLPFIIASVMCLPFLLFSLVCLLALVLKTFAVGIPDALTNVFVTGILCLIFWPPLTLTVVVLVSISVVAAWLQKGKTVFEIVSTGIYSAIMLFYGAYSIWCLVTKPVFDL